MTDLESRIVATLRNDIAPTAETVPTVHTCTALQAAVWTKSEKASLALGKAAPDAQNALDPDVFMDIASVTKLFTATLVLIAIDGGKLGFDTTLDTVFPELSSPSPTLLQLLNHSSGLPAWDQFYLRYPLVPTDVEARQNRESILQEILRSPRKTPGHHVYSDLGYILLGRLVERVLDDDLDTLVARFITGPLEMGKTRYVNQLKGDTALEAVVTEMTPGRPSPICGLVHDENCFIQGGVAGHAGLFSTADDLVLFGRHMLDIHEGKTGILTSATLGQAWSNTSKAPDGHHAAGWDTPSGELSSVGRGFSRSHTYGHLGFTGTSLWIDTSAQVVAALLTNRVFPTRENPRIKDLRVRFHEAILPASAA
jgi:CubicO group peptidase (beta-lactamase class C family)